MADTTTAAPLEPPRVYLVHMIVFTLVVAVLVAVLLPGMVNAFMANPFLNGVIIGTLLLGMFHSYPHGLAPLSRGELGQPFPRVAEAESLRQPQLLGPMATLLRNRQDRDAVAPLHAFAARLAGLAPR